MPIIKPESRSADLQKSWKRQPLRKHVVKLYIYIYLMYLKIFYQVEIVNKKYFQEAFEYCYKQWGALVRKVENYCTVDTVKM